MITWLLITELIKLMSADTVASLNRTEKKACSQPVGQAANKSADDQKCVDWNECPEMLVILLYRTGRLWQSWSRMSTYSDYLFSYFTADRFLSWEKAITDKKWWAGLLHNMKSLLCNEDSLHCGILRHGCLIQQFSRFILTGECARVRKKTEIQ